MYVAHLNKKEYRFSSLEEAAKFLYDKNKILAEKGEACLDFGVWFLTPQKTYQDLNSTELKSFNRYCADLWKANASPEELELMAKHEANMLAREEGLERIRKRNEN